MLFLAEELVTYVPALIADRLKDDPTPITAPFAERFPAVVLFADISGFTALTERLAQQGLAGVEQISGLLNGYFGRLIDIIQDHGGDVIKFAGDALLAIWRTDAEGASADILRAAQCGLTIQDQLHNYEAAKDINLSLRIAIGIGNATVSHIGGVYGRWEFVLTGAPIRQVNALQARIAPGAVGLSAAAWEQVADACAGAPLAAGADPSDPAAGSMRLTAIKRLPAIVPAEQRTLAPAADVAVRAYIPGTILARISAGQFGFLSELRRITVLFINLPGFDEYTSLQQGQDVMRTLQTAIYRFEGSINKLSVDDKGVTLIAAYGLPPLSHEDDPTRGLLAALDIHAQLARADIHHAISVTTGNVFCGIVGGAARQEYTIIGSTVNLAARLLQPALDLAATGGIPLICDQATYEAGQARLVFGELAPVSVKGRAEPVTIFAPREEKQAAVRPQTAIVGREAERAALADALQTLLRGDTAGVVLIEGEAGIGKSRLLNHVRRQAHDWGIIALSDAGDPVEKTAPYHGWREIFAALLGADLASDTDTRRRQVLYALGPELAERAPLLNLILLIDIPENAHTQGLAGADRADATRDLLVTLLQASLSQSPKVIFLEDTQWFDSASWALTREVSLRAAPVLLMVATRPLGEQVPIEYAQLLELPTTTHLRLQPLTDEQALTLVRQRLGVSELPEDVAALILDKAEGHPFFSEELAYAMRDRGIIEIHDGECRLAPQVNLRQIEFPNTVQGLIISRIDQLTPQQQLTLKIASVIGTIFPFKVLNDVHPIAPDKLHLPGYLQTLDRLELTLLLANDPDLVYMFKHIITQEVSYNLMLFSQRQKLHRAVAEWYESHHRDDLTPFYSILAHHWSRAEVIEKAIEYLEKAAEQALWSGMPRESVALGLEAIRLSGVSLPTAPDAIVPQIGAELETIRRLIGGRQIAELIDLPPLSDHSITFVIGIILRIQPAAHLSLQFELFALMALKNIRLTLEYGNGALAPLVYSMYAIVLRSMTGDSQSAYAFSQLALDLDERNGARLTGSVAFIHAWFINHWVNPLSDNLAIYQLGERRGFETGDVVYGCFSAAGYVVCLRTMGRPLDEIIAMADSQGATVAERVAAAAFHCRHEAQFAKALAGRTAGPTSLSDGRYDEQRDIASIIQTTQFTQIGYYYSSKLQLCYHYGQYEAALEYAEKTLPLLSSIDGQAEEAEFALFHSLALLAVYAAAGEERRPPLLARVDEWRAKLKGWSALSPANFAHKSSLVDAEHARLTGARSEARPLYESAIRSAAEGGFLQYEALGYELLARHTARLGNRKAAQESLDKAREIYRRWGAAAKAAALENYV